MRKNIPNALSLSRIVFAALFLLAYDSGQKAAYISGIALLVVGFGTDVLDGALARRWGMASGQGDALDSLGDRAMYISCMLTLVATGRLVPSLAWLLVFREVLLHGLRNVPHNTWHPVPAGDRVLTKTHAVAMRAWLFICLAAEGARLFRGYDLYAHTAFRFVLGLLLATSIVTACYASSTALWRLWMRTAREDLRYGNQGGG